MLDYRFVALHNLYVRVQGDELPGLDGSAEGYVSALRKAGVVEQKKERKEGKIERKKDRKK